MHLVNVCTCTCGPFEVTFPFFTYRAVRVIPLARVLVLCDPDPHFMLSDCVSQWRGCWLAVMWLCYGSRLVERADRQFGAWCRAGRRTADSDGWACPVKLDTRSRGWLGPCTVLLNVLIRTSVQTVVAPVLDVSHSVFWDESSECSRGRCVGYCQLCKFPFLVFLLCDAEDLMWLKTLRVKELLHFTVVCRKF